MTARKTAASKKAKPEPKEAIALLKLGARMGARMAARKSDPLTTEAA